MYWSNDNGIYTVPAPVKVDVQQVKRDMDQLEQRLQVAEAAITARKAVAV